MVFRHCLFSTQLCLQARSCRPRSCPSRRAPLEVAAKTDYAATASDANVLRQPLKNELTAGEVKHVFGYSNALKEK